jgi:DNA helicase HerA-like ATPase
MEEYGTVISTMEGPSTRKFSFVINKDCVVRRGQFVELVTEEGKLIGRVADVFRTNRYFQRPESVKEYESSGNSMEEIFPVGDWEYLVADVIPLGIYNGKGFQDVLFPASPGIKVREPEESILKDFFGLDDKGLHLGEFRHQDIDVKINTTRLLQKHLAILALSGAGKSYLTAVLIEELLKRSEDQGQLSVIIIDPHGEYSSFADDPSFSDKVKVFPVSDVRIGLPNMNQYNFSEFMPKLSYAQSRELMKVVSEVKKEKSSYGISDIIDYIETHNHTKAATRDVLISVLSELGDTGLFGVADYPGLEELARQGGISVIDLSRTTNMRKKQIITAYIARKLFNYRRRGVIPPFLLVLEEAHQFCPEKEARENALSRGVITTIAREGRKFHASLCLISQRPVRLSTTVLSQCNTHIILRVTNPYDLKHIEESSEGITRDVSRQISSLRVGNGLVVGEGVNFPLFMKIRERKSKGSDKGLPLERAAKEYHEKMKQNKKDSKSFM